MAQRKLARNQRRVAEVLAGERAIRTASNDPRFDKLVAHVVDNITRSIADVFAQSAESFNREAFYAVAGLKPME